jgi:hypothetical protein
MLHEVLMTEREIVGLLQSRNGDATLVTAWDEEPMQIQEVIEAAEPSPLPPEWEHFSAKGGVPLSADNGRYFFYSTEIVRIEDIASGALLFVRPPT